MMRTSTAAGSVALAAFLLASWAVCNSQASTGERVAFAAMPTGRLSAAAMQSACPLRPKLWLNVPSKRACRSPEFAGTVGLRAQEDDGDLRDEFSQLLGKSGRDRGMTEMKAPKGSLEWVKQQQSGKSVSTPAASPATRGSQDAVPTLSVKPGGPSLSGPPAKPKAEAPAPTYEDLDALLSGKNPAASSSPQAAPEIVAPAARPAYAVVARAREDNMVELASFDKGDAVPESVWAALTDSEGASLSLSTLAAQGGELVLLVPESASHTGAPAETWTKLLIDLQNMLGSQPDKVRAVAVSPESKEVHAKMISRYNLKLFKFVSDSDRSFVAAHKVWDPQAAQRGVSVERQTFIIDTATKKFAHVFHSVPAVGHAEAVRDVLQELQQKKADGMEAAPVLLNTPPPKPTPPPEAAAPTPEVAAAPELRRVAVEAKPALMEAPVGRSAAKVEVQDVEATKFMDEEEGFALDVDTVGPLIGRGGTRVKDLAARSGASIRFENEPTPTMFARGTSEKRQAANEIVQNWISSSGMERVPMPLEMHGRIIGSKGSKIKEIELKTRAHVLFEREPEPAMVVRGNETERAAAIVMANAILAAVEVTEEKMQLIDVQDRTHVRAVLGVKGVFVKALEDKIGVKVRYNLKEEDNNKFLILIGNAEQRQEAKALILEHLASISEVTEQLLDEDELRSLMGYKGQVVHRLEEESGAIISMEKDVLPAQMFIRGTLEQREKAWALAQEVLLNDAVETHDIPPQLRRVVVGPNGTVVKRLEAQSGASVTLLNDNTNSSRVLLRGKKEARTAAWKLIENIVYTEVGVDRISVDRRTCTELLRNKARRCKDLELSTGTYISVEKEEGTSSPKTDEAGLTLVTVRGLEEQRLIVRTALDEIHKMGPEKHLLKDLATTARDISILDVRRIIGPRGSRVADMEEETGASIRLEVEPQPYVSIMGTREQKDAALALIRTNLEQDDQEMVPLAEELHGVVIGVSGRSVQKIERESGAQVSFRQGDVPSMVLRGSPEQRALAKAMAHEMVDSDTAEHFIICNGQASALIGAKGRNIREVESATGARVQVVTTRLGTVPTKTGVDNIAEIVGNLKDDETLVIIKGTEEQRQKARELVHVAMEPEEADAEMQITEAQATLLLALRGAVRRDIEERCGARLAMNEACNGLVVYGKAAQREKARAALQEEFTLGEESGNVEGEFPLLMLRLIIGTGGANVRKLEQECGARIRFDTMGDQRDPTTQVVVKIRGKQENRAKAFELIAQQYEMYAEERMPLEFMKHFLLIGRGGDVVKAMESETNTAICFTQSPEPAMVVLGKPDDRARAIELAKMRVEGQVAGDQEVYLVPKKYHAELIGASGRTIQSIERRTGALIHFRGNDTDDCIITGSLEERAKAIAIIQSTIESSQESRLPVPVELHRTLIGPRGSTIKDMERSSGARLSFEEEPQPCLVVRGSGDVREQALKLAAQVLKDEKEEHFYVERRYHGWLIGPRGSRIRDIEDDTGTRIMMSREEPVVIVEGSRARREKAWELIQAQMDLMDETGSPDSSEEL